MRYISAVLLLVWSPAPPPLVTANGSVLPSVALLLSWVEKKSCLQQELRCFTPFWPALGAKDAACAPAGLLAVMALCHPRVLVLSL